MYMHVYKYYGIATYYNNITMCIYYLLTLGILIMQMYSTNNCADEAVHAIAAFILLIHCTVVVVC